MPGAPVKLTEPPRISALPNVPLLASAGRAGSRSRTRVRIDDGALRVFQSSTVLPGTPAEATVSAPTAAAPGKVNKPGLAAIKVTVSSASRARFVEFAGVAVESAGAVDGDHVGARWRGAAQGIAQADRATRPASSSSSIA